MSNYSLVFTEDTPDGSVILGVVAPMNDKMYATILGQYIRGYIAVQSGWPLAERINYQLVENTYLPDYAEDHPAAGDDEVALDIHAIAKTLVGEKIGEPNPDRINSASNIKDFLDG